MPYIAEGEPDPGHPGRFTPGEGSSWNLNLGGFGGLSPLFNALLGRYGQAMDYQLQDLSKMPGRNELAFNDWLKKRAFERESQAFGLNEAAEQQRFSQQQMLRAERLAEEERVRQEMEKRAALMAGIDRARALNTQYGGATPFTPAGALADYYEYGGQKAGGNAPGGAVNSSAFEDDRCRRYPTASGCPQDPLRPGGQGT